MRISDWSSDVCSSDLSTSACRGSTRCRCRPRRTGCFGRWCCACSSACQYEKDFHDEPQPDSAGCRGHAPFEPVGLHPERRQARPAFLGAGIPAGHQAEHDVEPDDVAATERSEEHTSELQSLMRITYAVFCLKKNNNK